MKFGQHDAFDDGAYLTLIDSYISQRKAQGPSGTCNESKEEEDDEHQASGIAACVPNPPSRAPYTRPLTPQP